jgi:hypothetical protein
VVVRGVFFWNSKAVTLYDGVWGLDCDFNTFNNSQPLVGQLPANPGNGIHRVGSDPLAVREIRYGSGNKWLHQVCPTWHRTHNYGGSFFLDGKSYGPSLPTAGTWESDMVLNKRGGAGGWKCITPGTFGTLEGVTGSFLVYNLATSVINKEGGISAEDTTIPYTIVSGASPASGILTVGAEKIYYASRLDGEYLECVRGYEGTTPAAHANGAEMVIVSDEIDLDRIYFNNVANGPKPGTWIIVPGAGEAGADLLTQIGQADETTKCAMIYPVASTAVTDAAIAYSPPVFVSMDTPQTKTLIIKLAAIDAALTTGSPLEAFSIPADLDGMNLLGVGAHVYDASISGAPTFTITRKKIADGSTAAVLSTSATIDVGDLDSVTATTPPQIDTANDDVAEGDEYRLNCTNAGTGTLGGEMRLTFGLPS